MVLPIKNIYIYTYGLWQEKKYTRSYAEKLRSHSPLFWKKRHPHPHNDLAEEWMVPLNPLASQRVHAFSLLNLLFCAIPHVQTRPHGN
jgi:hypothetical protein